MPHISANFDIKYLVADGVPCVAVRQPETAWWYVIALENVKLAMTTGVGHRRPGTLVCGYGHHTMENGEPSPGFCVGHFRVADLIEVYKWGEAL